MTQADPLAAYFDAAPAPAIDPAFKTVLMAKIARRRFRIELVVHLVIGVLLLTGFALSGPSLGSALSGALETARTALMVTALVLAGAYAGWFALNKPIALPRLRFL